jgi:cardiolipin synthase
METLLLLGVSACITTLLLLILFNIRTREAIERYFVKPSYAVGDEAFSRSLSGVLSADFYQGNSIQTLVGGEQIFSSMIEEIKKAQVSINLESFVCSSGRVCSLFIDALAERARAGVAVHVILDWMGSNDLHDDHYLSMKQAGIRVIKYRKLHWYNLPRLNNRSHRKILVVDGKVGFTGGAGIADQWLHDVDGMLAWRDVHYRFEGPIVAKMQAAFMENWLKSHARVLEGEAYFPTLAPNGEISGQLFTSSADGIEAVRLMFLLAIASAKKSIRILNAYFVPDASLSRALIQAATRRGVKVEIVVPGDKTDQRILQEVSRSSWAKLLQAGISIYEYQPTMHHGKLFIVDEEFVSIGSANCDGRSFRINDEMNVNVLDKAFAMEQVKVFEQDKKDSRLVTYKQWKRRPLWRKVIGHCGRLIQGQF